MLQFPEAQCDVFNKSYFLPHQTVSKTFSLLSYKTKEISKSSKKIGTRQLFLQLYFWCLRYQITPVYLFMFLVHIVVLILPWVPCLYNWLVDWDINSNTPVSFHLWSFSARDKSNESTLKASVEKVPLLTGRHISEAVPVQPLEVTVETMFFWADRQI